MNLLSFTFKFKFNCLLDGNQYTLLLLLLLLLLIHIQHCIMWRISPKFSTVLVFVLFFSRFLNQLLLCRHATFFSVFLLVLWLPNLNFLCPSSVVQSLWVACPTPFQLLSSGFDINDFRVLTHFFIPRVASLFDFHHPSLHVSLLHIEFV
jgi:hypothetical protein